jgi:hypothetical protein
MKEKSALSAAHVVYRRRFRWRGWFGTLQKNMFEDQWPLFAKQEKQMTAQGA